MSDHHDQGSGAPKPGHRVTLARGNNQMRFVYDEHRDLRRVGACLLEPWRGIRGEFASQRDVDLGALACTPPRRERRPPQLRSHRTLYTALGARDELKNEIPNRAVTGDLPGDWIAGTRQTTQFPPQAIQRLALQRGELRKQR